MRRFLVSGGIKADISPDPLPLLPREMSKQKNKYESWFAGHYPSPLQDGKSYTDKHGHATAFTTSMYENAVNSGLPPDKQLAFGQMFEYFTDCTLGQVLSLAGGENYCHEKHFLKGKLANNAKREHLRMNVFSHLIIDAINRKSVGARILIIGVMPNIIFPSILLEARSIAIDHFKEQGIYVKFDLQLVFSPPFCSAIHGLNQEKLAKMDNVVMQCQGNLLHGVDYFQWRWSHIHPAAIDKMKNLINYITRMDMEQSEYKTGHDNARWLSRAHTHDQLFYEIQTRNLPICNLPIGSKTKQHQRIENFALAFIPRHERVHQGDQGHVSRGKDGSK